MKLKTPLKQRHLEAWEEAFNAEEVTGASRFAGLVVRAAIKAGWFDDLVSVEAVDDMNPAFVRKLAKQVNDAYVEATTLDPN